MHAYEVSYKMSYFSSMSTPPSTLFTARISPYSSALQDMRDLVSLLPVELILLILQEAPDLASLYQFICASPRISAAFEIDSARIVDLVIARSTPEFASHARSVAVLRTLVDHLDSNPDLLFQPSAVLESAAGFWPQDGNNTSQSQLLWPEFAGTPAPRYVLLTAYRVKRLEHICISTLLHNIHDMTLSRPTWPGINSPGISEAEYNRGRPFKPSAWWPPSWSEKRRVQRILWKLMVVMGVRALMFKLWPSGWPDYTQACFGGRYGRILRHIGATLPPDWRLTNDHEMTCISKAVESFLCCSPSDFFVTHSAQQRRTNIRASLSNISDLLNSTALWREQTPGPITGTLGRCWGQDKASCEGPSYGRRFFVSVVCRNGELGGYVTSRDFGYLDRFGLCIWDKKRMAYLGLGNLGHRNLDPELEFPFRKVGFKNMPKVLVFVWRDLIIQELVRLAPNGYSNFPTRFRELLLQAWVIPGYRR